MALKHIVLSTDVEKLFNIVKGLILLKKQPNKRLTDNLVIKEALMAYKKSAGVD